MDQQQQQDLEDNKSEISQNQSCNYSNNNQSFQQSEKGFFITGLGSQTPSQEKQYLQGIINKATKQSTYNTKNDSQLSKQNISMDKSDVQSIKSYKTQKSNNNNKSSPFSPQNRSRQQQNEKFFNQQNEPSYIDEFDEQPDKPINAMEMKTFDMQSETRKFFIQLESMKSAMKIVTMEIKGKLDITAKHFEISVDQIKNSLLRKIEDENNKTGFMLMQVQSLEYEKQAIQDQLNAMEKRVRALEEIIGIDEPNEEDDNKYQQILENQKKIQQESQRNKNLQD